MKRRNIGFTVISIIIVLVINISLILYIYTNFRNSDKIYHGFSNEQKVTILGYNNDTMEPYISRDDHYLFFNNYEGPNDKDLYYAERLNSTTFQFKGEVEGVNSLSVDGNPSMDNYSNFYFISTRDYNPALGIYSSIYTGKFDDGNVTDLKKVEGNIDIEESGWINMGVEISGDGQTLYFSSAFFEGSNVPIKGNIRFAVKSGNQFIIPENEEVILQNINTDHSIEYAGEVSENGLELFYSQVSFLEEGPEFKLYYSNRSTINDPFGVPKLITEPFEGNKQAYVEAPSLSQDGKILYYHKLDNAKFSIFMLSRN